MAQLLLFPDPRPLIERLGAEFFRSAPAVPGVYLMRDGDNTVLYVGKAKNLRKRLASYRVANPDRLRRRHLRLLRAVEQIELRACVDEAAALAAESALLRTLRPRYNRAGTWPGPSRFLAWRVRRVGLELAVTQNPESEWEYYGPIGSTVVPLRAALARLIWCAVFPENGMAGLPPGWFCRSHRESCTIPFRGKMEGDLDRIANGLKDCLKGQNENLSEWVLSRTACWVHPFDFAVRERDMEILSEFAARQRMLQFASGRSGG